MATPFTGDNAGQPPHGFNPTDWGAGQNTKIPGGPQTLVDLARHPAARSFEAHPLYPVFLQAFLQATQGKGVRHGGDTTPFLRQSWVGLANQHGTGFLTGQAAKKLGEASRRIMKGGPGEALGDDAWCREVLGALVYGAMAYLHGTGAGL